MFIFPDHRVAPVRNSCFVGFPHSYRYYGGLFHLISIERIPVMLSFYFWLFFPMCTPILWVHSSNFVVSKKDSSFWYFFKRIPHSVLFLWMTHPNISFSSFGGHHSFCVVPPFDDPWCLLSCSPSIEGDSSHCEIIGEMIIIERVLLFRMTCSNVNFITSVDSSHFYIIFSLSSSLCILLFNIGYC